VVRVRVRVRVRAKIVSTWLGQMRNISSFSKVGGFQVNTQA